MCTCGKPLVHDHLLSCNKHRQGGAIARHNAIVRQLRQIVVSAELEVDMEVSTTERRLRPDLIIWGTSATKLVDVTLSPLLR